MSRFGVTNDPRLLKFDHRPTYSFSLPGDPDNPPPQLPNGDWLWGDDEEAIWGDNVAAAFGDFA